MINFVSCSCCFLLTFLFAGPNRVNELFLSRKEQKSFVLDAVPHFPCFANYTPKQGENILNDPAAMYRFNEVVQLWFIAGF